MSNQDLKICKLEDLDKLRSAPTLNKKQSTILLNELRHLVKKSDWITIGIMAPSLQKGLNAIRSLEKKFKYKALKCITLPSSEGPLHPKLPKIPTGLSLFPSDNKVPSALTIGVGACPPNVGDPIKYPSAF